MAFKRKGQGVGVKREAKKDFQTVRSAGINLFFGDSISVSKEWPAPDCIISDGPYGLGKFHGEQKTTEALGEWYRPHAESWAQAAKPSTTLWFWNTEIGWALTHSVLEDNGWRFEECLTWDKGIKHIAGNCNSKTIRGLPIVTEICARYTRENRITDQNGEEMSLKDWLRSEWKRSGLPMSLANEACGVANAATRKYLTKCDLWYFPPAEAVLAMAAYCQNKGKTTDRPYFSIDGKNPPTENQWNALRAKWHHAHGITNVWTAPAVHGKERLKGVKGYLHATQKLLSLMKRQILASTDEGDVIWEPFGGTCSASIAARECGRIPFAAEVNEEYFKVARDRVLNRSPER